jgi:hypothetical protein
MRKSAKPSARAPSITGVITATGRIKPMTNAVGCLMVSLLPVAVVLGEP